MINKALKIEDIKDGMWIWDNKRKCYCKVLYILTSSNEIYTSVFPDWESFEERRFYRFEVK